MKNFKIWRTICLLFIFVNAVCPAPAKSLSRLFGNAFSPAPLTRDGKIIAAIDFDPQVDGFSFRNYGSNRDNSEDLDAADLIRMFGAENVCIEGSTAKDCVLYETAEKWAENQIEAMGGGHCDGFSVTTLNLFVEQPFRGKSSPAQWQANAEDVFDLKFTPQIANFIAYHHALQTLPEVSTFRAASFKYPPSQILKLIADSFSENSKDLYTLGIGMRVGGQYTRGHSIVPIAIEDAGNDVYLIHVYDNNFPGQTKFVTVDAKNETWRYRTASDPNDTARDYVGNLQTKTMSLKKLSDRNRRRFDCPFGEDEEESEGSAEGVTKNNGEEIYISTDGEASLLIADPNGRRIGYDSQKKTEVNEIAGAQVTYVDGGLDQDLSPAYSLPIQTKAENPYTIKISGKNLEQEAAADLEISGSGFVIGLEDIALDPNENLMISIAPDFQSITFTASADGETPTLYFMTEDGADKPSYSFEVGGIAVDAGKSLTMSIDVEGGKVFFMDDDGNEDAYDIDIERTNPDGSKAEFKSQDLNMKGKDSFEIDFSKWDGKNQPCVEDDDDGDGFADEECGDAEEGGN